MTAEANIRAAPPAPAGDARAARSDQLRELGRRVHLTIFLVPGPGTVALYAVHLWLAPVWQFRVLLAAAVGLWGAFGLAYLVVRRSTVDRAAWIVFLAVWAFTTAVLALREGALGSASLAYVAVLVLVWIVSARHLWAAGLLVLGALVVMRTLLYLELLPVASAPPLAGFLYDAGLAVAIVPVLAFGLKLGSELNQLPLRHLQRSTEAQRRLLEIIARAQPEMRGMAEQASRGVSELAASANQQAATAERVAAASAELEQALQRTTVAAEEARGTAETSRRSSAETATRLADVERQLDAFLAELSAMVTSIEALSQRSAGTEQVIAAVEDVHQTVKVLAVNAGLEAARAGEAGKGIAVVASEMRTLIGSTESGVKEGRRLLGSIRADAAATIARAQETAARLAAHVQELREARVLVGSVLDGFVAASRSLHTIAAAEAEQRRQVEVVARSMRELNESAQTLDALAGELAAGVGQFARSQADLAGLVEDERKTAA